MKKYFSLLLALVLCLSLLQVTTLAAGTTHTLQNGGDLRAFLASGDVADGDTIVLSGTGHVNDTNSDSAPWVIDKAVTITGGDIDLRAGGILLGADVTFDGVELGFTNRVRNAIMANGHTLTLSDVTAASSTLEFHLFCGGLTGHSAAADAGTHGRVIVQGSSDVGNIYAGSLSADGAANSFTLPSTITLEGGSAGEVYACGAIETLVDSDKWFDVDYVPDPPTPNHERYTVTGGVSVDLHGVSAVTVHGAEKAAVQLSSGQNAATHTLRGVKSLALAAGASFVPSAASDLTGADVTLPATARLDLSIMGDAVTIGDFSGGGTLVFKAGQNLTITGAVSGTTSVETTSYGEYITAVHSVGGSFVCANGDLITRTASGSWFVGPDPFPIKTFALADAAAQTGDATATLPASVSFEESEAEWQLDVLPVDFIVSVNGNAAPYDEATSTYVDSVTGLAIYPSTDEEYFVVKFPNGGVAAGDYVISVTVPAGSTVDGADIVASATLSVSQSASDPDPSADPMRGNVYGQYVDGGTIEVISVDIEWGSMRFAYSEGGMQTWNPDAHSYGEDTGEGWYALDPSGDLITVTNHSNVDVAVTAAGTPVKDGVSGIEFDTFETNISYKTDDVLQAGQEGKYDEADYLVLTVKPVGTLQSTQTDIDKIADVTVTIEKYE